MKPYVRSYFPLSRTEGDGAELQTNGSSLFGRKTILEPQIIIFRAWFHVQTKFTVLHFIG